VRLTVAATAPFGADVLERLASRHEIELLLTRPDKPRGRGRHLGAPPAKQVAERLGIPVAQPAQLDASVGIPSELVVVVAYGLLIPDPVLEQALFLNVHPSLLPRWRGAAPVERAILAGDAETGVTIHRTVAALDAGPIAAQRAFPIEPDDDAGAVYARAGELAAVLLDEVLPEPEFHPQPDEGEMYAAKLTPEDRELDLARPEDALRRIRALSPHIGARAVVDGRPLLVWKARLGADGGLELLEVQPEGRRRMTWAEYRRGLR
jgi:methionyl-tRNA formyltransferase